MITRRRLLAGVGVGLGAGLGLGVGGRLLWNRAEGFTRARVFVGKAERYDDGLADVLRRGLAELGLPGDWARGKSVLLKPNLIEPAAEQPHINTHPAMVRAAAEVFRAQGAREVLVAEGQGHVRDSQLVLEQSGLAPVVKESRLRFVDLNHDELVRVPNAGGLTKLGELVLPATLRRADLVVSMPKMKTHHWAGATLSMKNLFGVMPGVFYGWPKNVLHQAGIPESIVDIARRVAPHLAIVDGVVGMEGDGPIMGTPKESHLVVLGTNLAAVDATAARLMDFEPHNLPYLRLASGRVGPIAEAHIEQRGEAIEGLRQRYALLDDPRLVEFRPR